MDEKKHKSFWELLFYRKSFLRALTISAIIGTLLIIINQGDLILLGKFPPIWKVVLTYLVPFSVSSYSSAKLLSEINQQE